MLDLSQLLQRNRGGGGQHLPGLVQPVTRDPRDGARRRMGRAEGRGGGVASSDAWAGSQDAGSAASRVSLGLELDSRLSKLLQVNLWCCKTNLTLRFGKYVRF